MPAAAQSRALLVGTDRAWHMDSARRDPFRVYAAAESVLSQKRRHRARGIGSRDEAGWRTAPRRLGVDCRPNHPAPLLLRVRRCGRAYKVTIAESDSCQIRLTIVSYSRHET